MLVAVLGLLVAPGCTAAWGDEARTVVAPKVDSRGGVPANDPYGGVPAAYYDGPPPTLELIPDEGPPGTLVRMQGSGFLGPTWRIGPKGGYGISLSRVLEREGEPFCQLTTAAEGDFRLTRDGRLLGYFVVPARGGCFQRGPLPPGVYNVILQCGTCALARFRLSLDP
jgi:hypothetical protein